MDKNQLKMLERCLQTASDAGSPIDQAQRFIDSLYIPLPWQWEFHAMAREADKLDGPVDIGVGGARGPGKSHAVLSQVALDDCQRVDRLKCLFLRQTGVAAKESFDDLIEKVVIGHVPYERVNNTLKVGNGSRIILGGFKNANDIDKYIGIEYDVIIVEELNQLTEEKYTKLRGSLRTSKAGWRPRVYTSFNPGGIGHAFVKERYITPHREGTEKETRFVGSTYKSNPHSNKEYVEYLESLTGDLGKAWREGEWDLFAGQVFGELSHIHRLKPMVPSVTFDHYLSFDWGYSEKSLFASYLSVVIKMKTEDGRNFQRIITYREWAGNLKSPHKWAEEIYKGCALLGVKPIKGVADSSMFDRQSGGGKPIAKLMREKWKELHGGPWCPMVPGTKNRIGRVATVHNWLSIGPDGLPYLMITETCRYLLSSLPLLIHDELRVDDVDCFVAGTMIMTSQGERPVETIRNGDFVNTPLGYRKVYITSEPKKAPVTKVELSNGRNLIGTSYHKVFAEGKGLIELQNLSMFDILKEWNTTKLSWWFIKASHIEDTLQEGITKQMELMLQRGTQIFIVKCGLIIMGSFLLISMFTILTIIRITIVLATLPSLISTNTLNFTTTREQTYKRNFQVGESQMGEKRRYMIMLLKCIKEVLLGNWRVAIVANLLQQKVRYKKAVQRNVGNNGLIKRIQKYVRYAKTYSSSKTRNTHKPVHITAVGSYGEKKVYSFTVEKSHLYYANGVLVTNTDSDDHGYDSISYFLYEVPFISINKGPIDYKQGASPKRVEWTKDGKQQIALDVREFENMYE